MPCEWTYDFCSKQPGNSPYGARECDMTRALWWRYYSYLSVHGCCWYISPWVCCLAALCNAEANYDMLSQFWFANTTIPLIVNNWMPRYHRGEHYNGPHPLKLRNGTYSFAAWAHLNITMSSCQYRNSHCKDKAVSRLSDLYNGNPIPGKVAYILNQGPELAPELRICVPQI